MGGGRRPRWPHGGRALLCGHAGPAETVSRGSVHRARPRTPLTGLSLLSQDVRRPVRVDVSASRDAATWLSPQLPRSRRAPQGLPTREPGAQRAGVRWPSPGHRAQNTRHPDACGHVTRCPGEGQRGRRQRPGHTSITDNGLRSQWLGAKAVSVRRENQWQGKRRSLGGQVPSRG